MFRVIVFVTLQKSLADILNCYCAFVVFALSTFSCLKANLLAKLRYSSTIVCITISVLIIDNADSTCADGYCHLLVSIPSFSLLLLMWFVKSFFTHTCTHMHTHTHTHTNAHTHTHTHIHKHMHAHIHTQHLCDSLTRYFTMESQVKLYRTTVLTIMNSGHGDIPLQVEEQVCLHWRGRFYS